MANATFQEWSLSGRNRRLADSTKPYTIYARLPKADKSNGYLVFAAKNGSAASGWTDKYNYVTPTGISNIAGAANSDVNWYIRMGDVSLPESGLRTVDLDTGILGTDQYNNEWSIGTALLPQRVDLSCQVAGKTLGATPYIFWGETLTLSARLIEGWNTDVSTRVRRWSIERNTGNATADAAWNAIDRSGLGGFGTTGIINLAHLHDNDDFAGCPATVFTVTAWGEADGQESELTEIDIASVTVLAESAAAQANAHIQTADRGAWSSSPTAVYMGSAGTYTPDGTLPEDSPYSRAVTVVDGQSVSDPYHFRTISYVTWLQYRLNNTYSGMTDRELMQQILTLLLGNVDLEVSRVWHRNCLWECRRTFTSEEPWFTSSDWVCLRADGIALNFFTDDEDPQPLTVIQVRPSNIDITVKPYLLLGNEDCTAESVSSWKWTRESFDTVADETWNTLLKTYNRTLNITSGLSGDIPTGWSRGLKLSFKCTATLLFEYGEEEVIINRVEF